MRTAAKLGEQPRREVVPRRFLQIWHLRARAPVGPQRVLEDAEREAGVGLARAPFEDSSPPRPRSLDARAGKARLAQASLAQELERRARLLRGIEGILEAGQHGVAANDLWREQAARGREHTHDRAHWLAAPAMARTYIRS